MIQGIKMLEDGCSGCIDSQKWCCVLWGGRKKKRGLKSFGLQLFCFGSCSVGEG